MAAPRFYLSVPPSVEPARLDALLPGIAAALDVAAMEIDRAGEEGWAPLGQAVLRTAQGLGIAVLLRDRFDLVPQLGADGVVLSEARSYRAARAALGPDRIVGVWAGSSRHEAMTAADAGADFVGLAPDAELVAWWAELMEVPCLAPAATPEDARTLAAAGTDFLATGPTPWTASDPLTAFRALAEAASASSTRI